MTDRILVVGAALYAEGRLLAARRSAPAHLAGRWELPGGKVDPGEQPEQALVREMREELGVEVKLLERVPGEWQLGRPGYILRVWAAELISAGPDDVRPLEDHDELRWLAPEELWDVDWLEHDRPAVAESARWYAARH